ncbi:MAG: disulfide bond formation protein B [Pseudomonadota bacterium]
MNFTLPAIRPTFFLLMAITVAAMGIALVMQYQMGLAPCPLCVTQRLFVILVGVFALLAGVHNPENIGRKIYAALCLLSAILGGAVASRHIWLQSLPEDMAPACGPSIGYMLETLPLSETFTVIMMGDGNCAETVWTFLGLSIPQQTLALFVVLATIAGYQLIRRD